VFNKERGVKSMATKKSMGEIEATVFQSFVEQCAQNCLSADKRSIGDETGKKSKWDVKDGEWLQIALADLKEQAKKDKIPNKKTLRLIRALRKKYGPK